MHFTQLRIDDFGCFRNARLEDLSDGLVVVGGPQRAGKSTFMMAIRQLRSGVSRGGDVPPATDEYRIDGEMVHDGHSYRYVLNGHASPSISSLGGGPDLSVDDVFGPVTEEQYRNLFTISLDELQRLPPGIDDTEDLAQVLLGAAYGDVAEIPEIEGKFRSQADDIGLQRGDPGSKTGQLYDPHRRIQEGLKARREANQQVDQHEQVTEKLETKRSELSDIKGQLEDLREEKSRLNVLSELFETVVEIDELENTLEGVDVAEAKGFPTHRTERLEELREEYETVVGNLHDGKREFDRSVSTTDSERYRGWLLDHEVEIEGFGESRKMWENQVATLTDTENQLAEERHRIESRIAKLHPDWEASFDHVDAVETSDVSTGRVQSLAENIQSLRDDLEDEREKCHAYAISDLLTAATEMQKAVIEMQRTGAEIQGDQYLPKVTDNDLDQTLRRHLSGDPRRFATSIDAVLNRITKLRERDFIWRMLNFVPEWDDTADTYADDQMLFDLDALLDSTTVVLIDTGDLRPASSNLFTVLMLDYLWSWVRLRKRWDRGLPGPADGYCVNLIIDEAAPVLKASLVRNEMIPDAREFALAFEVIVHFPEQVKRDALDTRAYKEILRNINTKLIGKLAIDDELATTLFHEDLDAEGLANRVASLPRGEWLAQLPDTGFMTDTPELVTLKPLPIPSGHSDDPVHPGTYRSDSEDTGEQAQTYQEADHLQWSRTRFTYCLLPGVNCPPDAAQRVARWGAGATNSGRTDRPVESAEHTGRTSDEVPVGRHSERSSTDTSSEQSSEQNDDQPSNEYADGRSRSGGGSNEYGTTMGTGTTPSEDTPERTRDGLSSGTPDSDDPDYRTGDDVKSQTSDGGTQERDASDVVRDRALTDDERRFLRRVIDALNGELDGYDLTESMTTIRNTAGSDIDVSKLEAYGYLEIQRIRGRKYYYVTPEGQTAVDRTLYRGRNTGDPHEKVQHKVYVEYLKRYIERQDFVVETYYEPMGGGIIYDVAAFMERPDGTRRLRCVGEVITNLRPEWIVKHYDDMARTEGLLRVWVVPNYDTAHELVRTLHEAGRVSDVPYKSVNNYETISEETFGDLTEWRILGATNLIDAVEAFSDEENE